MSRPATQDWVHGISIMQQSVLLAAIRSLDGARKHHPIKPLVRWYRRCVLLSAFDCKVIDNPYEPGGGSFTGPSLVPGATSGIQFAEIGPDNWPEAMKEHVDAFLLARDEMPIHFYTHFMHAAQIVGYKHPSEQIRAFWFDVYIRLVHALHLWPEDEWQMDARLGDSFEGWEARSDEAGSCST